MQYELYKKVYPRDYEILYPKLNYKIDNDKYKYAVARPHHLLYRAKLFTDFTKANIYKRNTEYLRNIPHLKRTDEVFTLVMYRLTHELTPSVHLNIKPFTVLKSFCILFIDIPNTNT